MKNHFDIRNIMWQDFSEKFKNETLVFIFTSINKHMTEINGSSQSTTEYPQNSILQKK